MTTKRRKARECITQILFQLDFNPGEPELVLERFWKEHKAGEKTRHFVEQVVNGVRQNIQQIDDLLAKSAKNWNVARMAATDRNVIRMATYEMLFCPDIPPVVSINEAVDVAKYFNTTESGAFVNGVLDRVLHNIGRPLRTGVEKKAE